MVVGVEQMRKVPLFEFGEPSGQANPSGLVPRSVIDVIVFELALDRSCAASIITRRSWYGIVITRAVPVWHGVSVHSRIAIGPYHLYGWVCPSVVDVMGFEGVQRASVGLQVPGAGILPLLSLDRVHSGAATTMITRLGPFGLHNFDYFVYFCHRSWSSIRGL